MKYSNFLFVLSLVACALAQYYGSVTDYAPTPNLQCPDIGMTTFVRTFPTNEQSIPLAEQSYISSRESQILPQAWKDWLGDGSALGYDLRQFENKYPRVGIAFPGGGLRAAQVGAAIINSLDARNDSAKAIGTGGLMQVMSYMTGLSGGSWLTGSMYFNDWPTSYDLVFGNGDTLDGWKLDFPFASPDGTNIFSQLNQDFYGSLLWSVISKAEQGIDTSLTDPWARMIAYHFLNQTTRNNFFTNDTAHGAGQLWSNIMKIPMVQQLKTPFPIVVADSRPVGSNITTMLDLTEVVYEISPLELASYDPIVSAGVNLTYAGTRFSNGRPDTGSSCVRNFDDAGFVMGTSASLFNQIIDFGRNTLASFSSDDSNSLIYVLQRQLQSVRTRHDDVANWPNPFNGINPGVFKDSDETWLDLIDGASNGENIPYSPLLVKSRGLDVIVSADMSADTGNSWPNGSSSLLTSSRVQRFLQTTHQDFPPLPKDSETWISQGLNIRPTFFGCEPKETIPEYPLVIYLPNSPPSSGEDPVTNPQTFQLTYTLKHTALLFDQVFKTMTSGFVLYSRDPDPDWPKCLQCAAIDRARYKGATTTEPPISRSDLCAKCFVRYCYDPSNPTSKTDIPSRTLEFFDPDPQGLDRQLGFFSDNKFRLVGGLIGLIAFLALMIGGLIWWRRRQVRQRYEAVAEYHEDEDPFLKGFKTGHSRSGSEPGSYEMPIYSSYTDSPSTGTPHVS